MTNVKVKTIVLKTMNDQYYTGRAGPGWVSNSLADAFQFTTLDLAAMKCIQFNKNTVLHGLTFHIYFK